MHYWDPINAVYELDITVVNPSVDPTFSFMTVDHDGKIRMDCSSPYAMARLVGLKDQYRVAFANDPDADRHGIVTPSAGLMNPNHYLAVAIRYLLTHRPHWPQSAAVGKTLVSSSMIDRVVNAARPAAVRSAGGLQVVRAWARSTVRAASAARRARARASSGATARVWTTDKDGLIMNLLAAEITARTGKDPGEHYRDLDSRIRRADLHPHRRARDARTESAARQAFARGGDSGDARRRADHGEADTAPGNDASIGGLKVVAANGWFAARPSGTENIYKIYAESFKDAQHLDAIVAEAQRIVGAALEAR